MNIRDQIIRLFKLGTSDSTLQLWSKEHPNRYSEDEVGFESWKIDLSHFNITDDNSIIKVLKNKIDSEIVNKFSNWSDFISIYPEGYSLKSAWEEKSPSKSFDSFLRWVSSHPSEDLSSLRDEVKNIHLTVKENNMSTEKATEPEKVTEFSNPDDYFYTQILEKLGVPVSKNNLTFFYAWRQAEGGKALFNPFNTTLKMEGATNYNKVGVKNYVSKEQGIEAIVKTLKNSRYESIINSMMSDNDPMETAKELVASPWGTSNLIEKVLQGYARSKPKPPPISRD
jgi:hypothetical protein